MLDSYFKISERGSTVAQEIRGGVVTFFTMAYIVALNPLIIGLAKDADGKYLGGGDVPNLALVAAATALIAGVMSILMGVVANFPLAIATGLGLNTFVALGIASQMSWADAMGLVVLEGIIITVLVLTGFRVAVFKAVPTQLKIAISVGIGLFIALIGLVDAGFVRRTGSGPVPVTLGDDGTLVGWPVLVFALGLFLTIGLLVKKVKGALLIGIVVATGVSIAIESTFKIGPNFISPDNVNPKGWGLNVPALPEKIAEVPSFDLLGQFSLFGSFSKISIIAVLLLVFTLLLADFFDTMGTMTAIGHEAGLVDDKGNIPSADRILLVDSIAATAGGLASVSSNTSYIESASGVGEGARTGLASVVTGILFLLTTFIAPLISVIPYEAAVPALIIVGFMMMTQIKEIDWQDYGIGIPAFLTIILMPFTYSIAVGIGAGFITHVVIRYIQGRRKEVHPLLLLVSGLFMIYFFNSPINAWIG
ncbi:MAG: NCS2 family permease [Actinobacteria bacterium]|nr:NCS2 family permease [Actinomycetota bacterium]MDA2984884.1 NCS2 family permease [Actinomycetota bacterium]